jgi:hypothetical protein
MCILFTFSFWTLLVITNATSKIHTVAIFSIVDFGKTFNTEFVRRQSATNYCSGQNSHKKTNPSSRRRGCPFSKHVNILQRTKIKPRLHCWRRPEAIYCSAILISQVIAGCCLCYTITKFMWWSCVPSCSRPLKVTMRNICNPGQSNMLYFYVTSWFNFRFATSRAEKHTPIWSIVVDK